MDNGDFDSVHPAIIRVTYVDIDAVGGTDELNNGSEPNQVRASSSSGPSSTVIISASVAALFVVGALIFYHRRRTSKNGDDELGDAPELGSLNSNVV